MIRRWWIAVSLSCALSVTACGSTMQSVLHPAGPDAALTRDLFVIFTIVVSTVWLLVVGMLVFATVRGRRRTAPATDDVSERRARAGVLAATSVTVIILIGLLTADLVAGRALADHAEQEPALTIDLTGHQWWWEARYEDAQPERQIATANELHIPVGTRVMVKLKSHDVIHSFWVPSLNGKQDLTPGYTNIVWLYADSAGVYGGQCAEYCGHQHAHMALLVIAESVAEYRAWHDNELRPAVEPSDSITGRGRDVFLSSACVMCHTIRGTPARGRTAPDLTHVGSRRTIAAGNLPASRAGFARWISDPHAVKPGVNMPRVPLSGADVQAVAAYLASLK